MITARLARQARAAVASRSRGRPTGSISAYDCYLRALQLAAAYHTVNQAEPYLQRAIELDPEFAAPHAVLSFVQSIKYYWSYDPEHLEIGLRTANIALQLDPRTRMRTSRADLPSCTCAGSGRPKQTLTALLR